MPGRRRAAVVPPPQSPPPAPPRGATAPLTRCVPSTLSFAYGAALGFLPTWSRAIPGAATRWPPSDGPPAPLERRLWRDHRGRGALYTALCAGGAAAVAAALARTRAVRQPRRAPSALTAAVTWAVLGGTSLGREARAVGGALEAGDLAAARARLPHLCGRDPQALDGPQIARAVVESVAENTSDAVVGALVWGAAGGSARAWSAFRAVNTLDAMVGHRSPRHLRFGWASARLDDLAGWPRRPAHRRARGPRRPRSARGAGGCWRRDAGAHPSPNAGPVEAAFAGRARACGWAAPSRTRAGPSTGRCSARSAGRSAVGRHRTRGAALAAGRRWPGRRCRGLPAAAAVGRARRVRFRRKGERR